MKKNFSVNINNKLFNIDEDAYELLNKYFTHLETSFSAEVNKKEIIENFHIRISQMLQKLVAKDENKIVSIEIVEKILQQLNFIQPEEKKLSEELHDITKQAKRLFRNPDDRIIGGVCGGLSKFFNVDSLIIRIVFSVLILFFGFGILAYLLLWIFVPEAKSQVDKLFMEGEEISVENIKTSLSNEFKTIEKNLHNWKKRLLTNYNYEELGYNFRDIFFLCTRIIIGLVLIFISLFLVIGLITIFFQPFGKLGLTLNEIPNWDIYTRILFKSSYISLVLEWALFILLFFPFASIFFSGLTIITGKKFSNIGFKWIFQYTGILSLTCVIVIALFTYLSFLFADEVEVNYKVNSAYKNRIFLDINRSGVLPSSHSDSILKTTSLNLYEDVNQTYLVGKPQFSIIKADDNKFEFLVQKRAYGRNPQVAKQNLENINYTVSQLGDTIFVSNYWSSEPLWRAQNVKYVLKVPINRRIIISNDLWQKIYESHFTYDGDVKLRMTKNGLIIN